MAAANNFKPFGIGSGANVTTQADYEALAALISGFQSGKASSAQINKALRQGTVMASVLAQFIANTSGADVLDNGNTAAILTNLLAGLKANGSANFLQIANNLSEIAAAGTTAVAAANANLGLLSAAKRAVGTAANQIPDMSSFASSDNAQTGWYSLPNGHIHQYGTSPLIAVGTFNPVTTGGVTYYTRYYQVTLPRAYPTAQISTLVSLAGYPFDSQTTEYGSWANSNRTLTTGTVSKTQFVVSVTSNNSAFIPTIHYSSEGY